MERVLTVDIGGTTIKCGYADRSGLRGDPWEYATSEVRSAEELASLLSQDARQRVDSIGVAAAGVVDREAKSLESVANWSGWDLDPLAEAFGVPLVVENDADASVLGLKQFGDVDDDANLAYLTISTGIGVGILRDGDLIPGAEAGFANLNWDGTVRHAGVDNPWEGYASGANIGNRVRDWLAADDRETTLTGREEAPSFFEAVYAGDAVARDYYTRLKRINAAGIGTITDLFSTELFKVGGGVATNHPDLVNFDDDPHSLEEITLDDYCITAPPAIEMVDSGDDLELLGAAAAAFEHLHA